MKISFVTSVQDLDGYGGGNQRSKCLFESLKNIVVGENTLEIVAIGYDTFNHLEVEDVENLYMANDIEFAMKLSWGLENNEKKAEEFFSRVKDSDYIVIDNCYHYPLVEAINKRQKGFSKIIYLSQNFESGLKSEIAESLSWESNAKTRYLDLVRTLELKAWTDSDFRVVCSKEDAKNLNNQIHRALEFELIPNGANKRGRIEVEHDNFLISMGFDSYVLFVSSGHPPNIKGFIELLGLDFGFLPPNSRLVIVGTSGPKIRGLIQESKYWETFKHRVIVMDQATEFELDNLYTHCSAILVPILQGSGTSIKAIESILTGKKVIGTEFAFRGLPREIYISPQVSIANNSQDFRLQAIKSLKNGIMEFERDEIADSYLWSSQVTNASQFFSNLFLNEGASL
jgi:hypothetical protein